MRPHDIEVSRTPLPDGGEAAVTRVVRLGFEVRLETRVDGEDVWAQLTRGHAESLDLRPGDSVHLRPGRTPG